MGISIHTFLEIRPASSIRLGCNQFLNHPHRFQEDHGRLCQGKGQVCSTVLASQVDLETSVNRCRRRTREDPRALKDIGKLKRQGKKTGNDFQYATF
jgi:hypothetical protein